MGDFDLINEACLDEWGQALTHTPAATPEVSQEITGVLRPGATPENKAPGDGSTVMNLFLKVAGLNSVPIVGDEISDAVAVYTVVRVDALIGGALSIFLRKDRDA